ncbi:hypothetical protein [Hymenobacter edaphi]|uniref:Uncharacterized protein n=1 Tax=Hymenobacter edaphi TaxID=2211146 RepID=A0A328BHG8_9BACT|nr:hypothetical protein [Hymenobacter edaphi]RAK66039.1 hypothetical protein DLM85_15155 [Hymenobacter edaphi]
MEKYKEDQLAMCGRVATYLAEHASDLAVSEVAAQQAADVQTLYAQVAQARSGTARRTEDLTAAAQAAQQTLYDLLPALLGPLGRVAERLGDADLQAAVTLGSKQLRKLRPVPFASVVGAIMASAARPDVAPELAKQGLTAKALQPLTDALATFRTAQPAVRKTINERAVSGAALEDLLADLMDELRTLDEDMKAFKLLDRPLFDGYTQARKIIESGGRGSKSKPAAG